MPRFRSSIIVLLLLFLGSLVAPAYAQSGIQVTRDAASLTFPESINFQAEFQSGAEITSVVLEYGVDQLTCGTVEARAFPQFTPGSNVNVQWTWEMRQSGSLPPGATVWWRWQVSDASGAQFTGQTKSILWLDSVHPWQVITGGNINLHYYHGGKSFGQSLHTAATQALLRLTQDVGLGTESPIDIYIYANTGDLREAVLYEPAWVGGRAFPQNNIVIIGITPDQLDWGRIIEAHELTHVLVGHLTFSCLGFIPTWLNEGLAKYGGGVIQAAEQNQFDQARLADDLPSLRSLAGGFSEVSSRAILSYTESYSVVSFMIKTYGRDKMTALLKDLRDGRTVDEALQAVYGFNTDGLEEAWRLAIGAKPRAGNVKPTPLSTPTQVPTFVPVGATPVAAAVLSTPPPTPPETSATPTGALQPAIPTVTALPSAQQPGMPLSRYAVIGVGLACLVILVFAVGLPIFLSVRSRQARRK